jgi:hypothetical protein
MIKQNFKIFIISLLMTTFLIPQTSFAQGTSGTKMMNRLNTVAEGGGYNTNPEESATPKIVGLIVGLFIGFLGLTFLVLTFMAGYTWMTASGNEEKIKKAKSTMTSAITGLIVALSAWIIWDFIYQNLIR